MVDIEKIKERVKQKPPSERSLVFGDEDFDDINIQNESKGRVTEKRSRKALNNLGFDVEKRPDLLKFKGISGDFWGLIDFIALKNGVKPKFIQVKTNSPNFGKYQDSIFSPAGDFEIWVRYDNTRKFPHRTSPDGKGWKIFRKGYTRWDEIAVTKKDTSDALTQLLEKRNYGEPSIAYKTKYAILNALNR